VLAFLLVAVVLSVGACGDDDDRSPHQAAASTPETQSSGAGKSGGQQTGEQNGSGSSQSAAGRNGGAGRSPSRAERSGGSGAPRVNRPVSRRSLARYLAERYRLTQWYGTIVRLRVGSGKVFVYTSLDPESDDENPQLVACKAVHAYSSRIRRVTVYGQSSKPVPTKVLQIC
jgi:hypothetical protein